MAYIVEDGYGKNATLIQVCESRDEAERIVIQHSKMMRDIGRSSNANIRVTGADEKAEDLDNLNDWKD